jgi:hypothetical protein
MVKGIGGDFRAKKTMFNSIQFNSIQFNSSPLLARIFEKRGHCLAVALLAGKAGSSEGGNL